MTEYVDPPVPSQLPLTEAALAAANARIETLEAALRPFAEEYKTDEHEKTWDGTEVLLFVECGYLRAAAEALHPTQQPAPEPPAIPTLTPYAQRQIAAAEQKSKRT